MEKIDASRLAVDSGLIEGLGEKNQFVGIPWRLPGPPLGPYSKVEGIESKITEGPNTGADVTFYLGKSKISKKWEVFSVLMKKYGESWKPVPVTLPNMNNGGSN